MSILAVLLATHSLVRWLLVLVSLAVVGRFAWGGLRRTKFAKLDQGLISGFGGLMDLQATLGLVFFLWSGFAQSYFPPYRFEHAVTMLLALAVAHLPARWKKASDEIRFRSGLLATLGALALIVVGVFLLPSGWLD
jgi:hypothetical protein